jgi:hypothetical protein
MKPQIEQARKLLQPSEVTLHKFPIWLKKRIAAYRKEHGIPAISKEMDFQNVICDIADCHWLDHWGTSQTGHFVCCRDCFVSEPYDFTLKTAQALEAICQALGLVWHVTSDSWWNPGNTLRITIHEKHK